MNEKERGGFDCKTGFVQTCGGVGYKGKNAWSKTSATGNKVILQHDSMGNQSRSGFLIGREALLELEQVAAETKVAPKPSRSLRGQASKKARR